MPFRSQDLQQVFAKTIGRKIIPPNLLRAIKKYNPRLENLLKSENKKVFESDLEKLIHFVRTGPLPNSFSPNKYTSAAQLQKELHKGVKDLKTEYLKVKHKKSTWKQEQIAKQLKNFSNIQNKEQREKIQKIANIRKAKKLSEKQKRARDFIKEMVGSSRKKYTTKTAGTEKPSINTHLKIQDLAV